MRATWRSASALVSDFIPYVPNTNEIEASFFGGAGAVELAIIAKYCLRVTGVCCSDTMPTILIPIGDAAETMDTLYPFYRLREEGWTVVVAGPEKRLYSMVLHEIPPGWDITQETAGYHLAADVAFRDVVAEDIDALFL